MGGIDPASAQRGGRDYGDDGREYGGRARDYDDDEGRERGRSYEYDRGRERGRGYDEEDRDRRRGRGYDDDRGGERDRRSREERESTFDEDEYLRCHPDVRRAVERGDMESGAFHYRNFGRREGRRLTCPTRL
jgi:hypothetical protein